MKEKLKTLFENYRGTDWGMAAEKIGDNVLEIVRDFEEEVVRNDECWNAVISYMLGKGYTEEPLEFLRCWNEGDFDALREEWPDAPKEIYYADPLYKGE